MEFSLGAVHIFSHPRLELRADGLSIVGVFRDLRASYGAVTNVDADNDAYLRLTVDGRARTVMGLEKPKYEMVRGSEGTTHGASGLLQQRIDAADSEPTMPTRRTWTRPDRSQWLLLAGWLLFFGASAASAAAA